MRRIFEHKLAVFLIAATLIAAVIIGVRGARGGEASFVENIGGSIMSPVQGAASGAGGIFRNIGGYFGNVKSLRSENERLNQENTGLQKQIRDMQGLADENEELRRMLKLQERQTKLDMVAASVSSKNPSNWYASFTINKGSGDGIKENQPVVDSSRHLVGQISRVGSNWADVITILDSGASLGAVIRRSKEIGIIEGDAELRYDGKCRLGYIARDTDIQTGDYVETSGLGGVFPKGLLVGTVYEIYDENSTMSKAATIEPLADIAKLNEVFVITGYSDADLSEQTQNDDSDDNKDDSKNGGDSNRRTDNNDDGDDDDNGDDED